MATAQNLPDVQSFRDLAALRQRITDNMRAARSDPNRAQEVKRQTDLLISVHSAMENSVNGQTASDAAAVQARTRVGEVVRRLRCRGLLNDERCGARPSQVKLAEVHVYGKSMRKVREVTVLGG